MHTQVLGLAGISVLAPLHVKQSFLVPPSQVAHGSTQGEQSVPSHQNPSLQTSQVVAAIPQSLQFSINEGQRDSTLINVRVIAIKDAYITIF